MTKSQNFKIAGISNYTDNIIDNLISDNPDYDMSKSELIDSYSDGDKIYQYDFKTTPLEVVPEPDNEHDSNAVAVKVDGILVGYIKAGNCSRVKNLLKSPDFHGMDLELAGGKFKKVIEEENDKYSVEKGEAPFFAVLTIYTKEQEAVSDKQAPAPEQVPPVVNDRKPSPPPSPLTPSIIVPIALGMIFFISTVNRMKKYSTDVNDILIGFGISLACFVISLIGIFKQIKAKKGGPDGES